MQYTNSKATPPMPNPTGALIELKTLSDNITHARANQISRFGLTPPTSDFPDFCSETSGTAHLA